MLGHCKTMIMDRWGRPSLGELKIGDWTVGRWDGGRAMFKYKRGCCSTIYVLRAENLS